MSYRFQIEVERVADGRWIAEIPRLPGVMVYGKTKHDAVRSVRAPALRVLADRIERTKTLPTRELAFLLHERGKRLAQHESTKGLPRVTPPWPGSQASQACRLIPNSIDPSD